MPPYLSDATLWLSLLPILGTVAIAAILTFVTLAVLKRGPSAAWIILPLSAFLLLGLVTGYMTGLSRESVVGAVLPAVLSLLGGVAAVLIGRSTDQTAMLRVSGLMFVFTFGLLLGSTWGSAMRQAVEDFETSELELMNRSHIEAKVREFRQALKLPPEFPGTEKKSKSGEVTH